MMKNRLFAVIILAMLLGAGAAVGAPSLGVSSGHDLDALWAAAQTTYDLAQEDAVLLLESRRVAIGDAGEVATTVQRVVWIGTAAGLRAHADLRVPWNSATCTFEVAKLRTWREGRWWPDVEKLSDTAIVPTLPYAVDHADDYTTMRETMLLHDGVELPCVMETEYTITERGLPGADDVFVMAQRDPAVLVELLVSAPAARTLHHRELNGAGAPATSERDGTRTLTWTLQPAAALRLPLTAKPSAYEPGVIWSTWADHRAMGAAWSRAFQAAAVAPAAALDSLRAAVREASGDQARLEAGGRWLDQSVRHIRHDDRWWTFAPRPAARTWETAYGHGLDRAVLWASLLRGEGWSVAPVLLDQPRAALSSDPPWLTGRGRLLLRVAADRSVPGQTAWLCDPADFTVHGDELLVGRELVWLSDECTVDGYAALPGTLAIELSLAADDSAWTGSGFVGGAGRLAFHHQTAGAADAVATHLGKLADSLVGGAETPATSLTMSTPTATSARFDVTAPFGDKDKAGRRRLVIGRPLGGLLDHLPSDCRLDEAGRATPVLLDALGQQAVTVRLRLPEGAVVARPADRTVQNAAGSFRLAVVETNGWLTYDRAVTLGADAGKPENWPALRALLLEEADAANATITWRPAEKK